MAKKGLKHVVFAKKTTAGAYMDGIRLSPAVRVSLSLNKAEGKDYGDDIVVDSESSVTGGTVEVELNHDENEIYTYLLGHDEDTTTHEIDFNVNDVVDPVGMGFLQPASMAGGNKWIGIWVDEVRFSDPDEEANTKTDSVTFAHITLSGDIIVQDDGQWKTRKVFATAADGIAWLAEKAGGTVSQVGTVTTGG